MTPTAVLKPPVAIARLLHAITGEVVLLYSKTQDAMTLVATAENARDKQLADADKMFAEARAAEEVARNAGERQTAEAKSAEAKAETEYQAAVNAQRRAAADADKTEAEARTAKQAALNAVLRSKAEASKAVAATREWDAELKRLIKYPYNCAHARTFAECAETLTRVTANGTAPRPPF
jgi:hypothetical protein